MWARCGWLVALAACKFAATAAPDAPAGMIDGGIDAPPMIDAPDGPPGLTCYGTGLVKVCPTDPIPATLGITSNRTVTTDNDVLCAATGGDTNVDACVVIATTIALGKNVRGTGLKPLVVVAVDTLTLDAKIDVSSSRTGIRGASSNPATCATVATTTAVGFPGGSFGGKGGSGGNGGGSGDAATATHTAVSGGGDGTGPKPGQGGGAVWLIAGTSIHLTTNGLIDASGSGGGGGTKPDIGGSGGSSGGLIGLDAPAITVDSGGVVFASGGGGGEGADTTSGGTAGGAPDPASPNAPATGGTGGTTGGGDGGNGDDATGTGANGKTGVNGGGGGGAAGFIQTYGTVTNNGKIVPAPH